MNLTRAMSTFVAVCENSGFAAAGRALNLSKALVSKQISDLESHLGIRLLNRTTRKMSLTEAGHIYLEHCRSILEQMRMVEGQLGEQTAAPKGILKITAPYSYGQRFFGNFLAEFSDRYSEVQIDLELNDRFINLVDEGFDVAIRIGTGEGTSTISRKLAETRVGLFASPGYLKGKSLPKTEKDFQDHQCLIYSQAGEEKPWRFSGKTFVPRWSFKSNNGDVLRDMALAGEGIVSLPDFFIQEDLSTRALVEISVNDPPFALQITALYPLRDYLPLKVRVFIDFMVDKLSQGKK
ncbi:MAG: LysR family transcriptional regulator [Proteobacteria bacterium]|nr:LysR family transcriptional regulator [Pseudomonadota bacterium]